MTDISEPTCPIPSTHEKCSEAQYFLGQCLLNYHDARAFLFNLNAFIQAFRNITFMLQSEDSKPDGFSEWYEKKQIEMRGNPLLRRLVDARNIVVKQSTLTAKSSVMCGLFRGRRMKLSMKSNILPFTDTIEIFELTKKHVIGLFLDEAHQCINEQVGVEREWIVDELGEVEVMSLCVEAMNYMIALVDEAHNLVESASGDKKISVDLRQFYVLLESDIDPSLPEKWGWL